MEILNFFAQRSAGFIHGAGPEGTRHLFSVLPLRGHERVLEIGVGTGASLVVLKSVWPRIRVEGLDCNAAMLRSAERRLRFCGLRDVPLHRVPPDEAYPFATASFDLIFAESVLAIQPTDGLRNMLREFQRLLRPGGHLAFNENIWLPGWSLTARQALNQRCRELFDLTFSNAELADVTDWKKLLAEEGWQLEYCARVEAPSGRMSLGWRNRLSQGYSKWQHWRARRDSQYAAQAQWLADKERELADKDQPGSNAYIMLGRKG